MRNFIFWMEYIMNKKVITFITLLAIGLVIVGQCSCTTTKKAVQKVASTDKFKPAEETLLAIKCAAMFPVKEFVTPGTDRVNDSAFQVYKTMMEKNLALAINDFNNLGEFTDSLYLDNKELNYLKSLYKSRIDSLGGVVKELKNGIPCPQVHTRDTIYQDGGPVQAALQIKFDQAKLDLAAKDITIQDAKAEIDKVKNNLNKAEKNRWDLFWIGIGVGAGAVIGVGTFLKLKSII